MTVGLAVREESDWTDAGGPGDGEGGTMIWYVLPWRVCLVIRAEVSATAVDLASLVAFLEAFLAVFLRAALETGFLTATSIGRARSGAAVQRCSGAAVQRRH